MSILAQLETQFDELEDGLQSLQGLYEKQRAQMLRHAKALDLARVDIESLQSFLERPYLIRPVHNMAHVYELVLPRFIKFVAGWPMRNEGEYIIYRVSRFIDLLTDLPDWLRSELEFDEPEFEIKLDGLELEVLEGDAKKVWDRFGKSGTFTSRRDTTLKVKGASRFDLIRELVREGISYYPLRAIPDELLRENKSNIVLRDKQARDWQVCKEYGAVSVIATGGGGKSYFGMYAIASLKGRKVVLAPTRVILDQWRNRILAHCGAEVLKECEFKTFSWVGLKSKRDMNRWKNDNNFTLKIIDEIQHLPSDSGIRVSEIDTDVTIGLSATPWREDGNEELIIALCGIPVGLDWESGAPPQATVYVVKNESHKYQLVEQIVSKPVGGKTMLFVYRLAAGRKLARLLSVPFVHGATKNPLNVIKESKVFVISKVGDKGVSIDNLSRVIEVDYLGGRAELGQRALRQQHTVESGELHLIYTKEEYKNPQTQKRLSALWSLGIQVEIRSV